MATKKKQKKHKKSFNTTKNTAQKNVMFFLHLQKLHIKKFSEFNWLS